MGTRPAWLLGLPLAVLGWLSAHAAAYELVAGGDTERALAATGHGYLSHAPLVVALCLVLTVAGFLARTLGRSARPLPAWVLGALPLLGFVVQEHLERVLQGGILWGTALEPVFLVGLVLQLPFALGAALLARALTGLADTAGGRPARKGRFDGPPLLPGAAGADERTADVLAAGHAGRAPPVPA